MRETGITAGFITVDGAEVGTGAAPVEFSNRLGVPCLEGTNFVHNCLVGTGLRGKIRIISSAKTATGFDIVTKLAIGAAAVNAARTISLLLGCLHISRFLCGIHSWPKLAQGRRRRHSTHARSVARALATWPAAAAAAAACTLSVAQLGSTPTGP